MDNQHGPITAILAALTRLGEADTKQVAVEAGIAYSTTVKKLRGLAADGRALRRDNGTGPAVWRAATSTEPANAGPVDAQTATDPDTAPNSEVTTARPDHGQAPEPASTHPDPDNPTSQVDARKVDTSTEETHTAPVISQEPDSGADEPAPADQPDDTADDISTPESGAAHPTTEAAVPPANETTPNGSGPDSSGPTDSVPRIGADAVTAEADDSEAGAAPTAGPDPAEAAATPRRGKGRLRDEVLAVLQDNPDTAYKVSQLSKLLGGASQGAITNALHKLVTDGTVTQTVERPATYQAH